MNRRSLYCAVLLIFFLTGTVRGEIMQRFDSAGNLVSPKARPTPPAPFRFRKYAVPEGLELRKDVMYHFYPVFGRTYAEIVLSAEENRPGRRMKTAQQPYPVDWSLSWSYEISDETEYDEEIDKIHCYIMIHDITLLYDISMILPALTDDSALNRIEKDLWKNYVARILESGHARVKIIKDDMKDVILQRMAEITYLQIDGEEAESAEQVVERYVRNETARIGKDVVQQIQMKLEQQDEATRAKPAPAAKPDQGSP